MNEQGKELRDDIKEEMWGTAIDFLNKIDSQSIADLCWHYNDDGAIEKIEIAFETPIYLTNVSHNLQKGKTCQN